MRYATQPPAESVVIFTGRRGEGKSVAFARYLAPVVRTPIWDPKNQHSVSMGAERLDVAQFERRAFAGKYDTGIFRVSVGPQIGPIIPDGKNFEPLFERFMAACWFIGGLCCAIEEVSTTGANANYCPDGLATTLAIGRDTRHISIVCTAQRYAQVPKILESQLSRAVIFRQSYEADIERAEQLCWPRTVRKETAIDIRRMAKYCYIDWTPEAGAVLRPPIKL